MTPAPTQPPLDRRLSIAPMMDWTNRHCRAFLRVIAPRTLLYTEMVTTGAILHGDRSRLLDFDAAEHPVALQLGGSEPDALAACAGIGAARGYDEIDLNCGCPSDRVQRGRFGACLMREPDLVAACVAAMRGATDRPVTVKCRIGVDDADAHDDLLRFVDKVGAAGCGTFVVHARKAWLQGLSPKENREIPPLRYDVVQRLKAERPDLRVVVNGGISTPEQAAAFLEGGLDGVMIGRAAYQDPYSLTDFETAVLGRAGEPLRRHEVVEAHLPYLERQRSAGTPLAAMTRHMLGLFNGLPGARRWRRMLSEEARTPGAGPDLVRAAAAAVSAPETLAA